MTLVLDAGHGGDDAGCVANGLAEKDLTLAVVLHVRRLARSLGYAVGTTRASDERLRLAERGARSRALQASQVISIHFDSNPDPSIGHMTFYKRANDSTSRELSTAIASHVPPWLGPPRTIDAEARGWKHRAHNVVCAYGDVPTLLIECAFLTNVVQAARLRHPRVIAALAASLFAGILDSNVPLTAIDVPLVQSLRAAEKSA